MASASERIFRKGALDRLSSPEQLDRLVTLASPTGWASLAAIFALLVAIVAWGFVGSIPTRVQGSGILVTRGGQVFDAMAPAAGAVAGVAAIGTAVQKGDVVATLGDEQLTQNLEHAQNAMREQQQQLDALVARFDQEIAARRKVGEQQRENLREIIRAAEQRRQFYAGELERALPVVSQGFISRRFVQDTRQQMETAEQEVRRSRNDLLRTEAEELDLVGRRDQEVWHQQEAVNTAKRTVDELTIKRDQSTRIISPIAGHVTELKASVGTVVAPGKPVLSIETAGKQLEVMLYIPPEQGKRVAPGMEVRIEPATSKKEEVGTLIGRVLEISEYPISPDGMLAVLQNQQLVTLFSARGAPYAARIGLLPDPLTPSGYAWSAGKGPPVTLSAGTTATAEVTVRTQAPAALVLPLLREKLGIGK